MARAVPAGFGVCQNLGAAADPMRKGIAVASTEVEQYNGVDPAEVPSAAWGWSKINVRTWHAVGVFAILFLLAMLHGNHVGHVEDNFLVGFAVLALFVLVRDWWGRRRGWIR
ncbi:hypothetical protein MSIM_06800 [Mycobacterium simiae]|nr:hypothetical protein MSIM_06800 [Mycobacterium simiae]